MGQLFSWLGVKLEKRINLAADRLGYGPQALRRKLWKQIDGPWWETRKIPVEERKGMIGKLMKYVSSGTTITQSQALELICDLFVKDLSIRDEFLDAGLYAELQNLWLYCDMAQKQYQYLARRDPDIDFLLASSRKALIFVEENEVNTVAKPFLGLDTRDFWDKPFLDKLVTLSPLHHAFTVLLRQSNSKGTRDTPIGTLAFAYWNEIRIIPLSIVTLLRTEFHVTPFPSEKIELCIRVDFLSFFHSIRTDRIFVRHCIFKSLTEERKLWYYSVVQRKIDYYTGPQQPDFWDNIPLPTLPDKYSNVEMELISVAKVPVDSPKLDELRFSLPTGLDNAILHDNSWHYRSTGDFDTSWHYRSAGGFDTENFLTVWEISSES